MIPTRAYFCAAVMAVAVAGRAYGVDLVEVLPAAMGQPQINLAVINTATGEAYNGLALVDFDPETGQEVYAPFFNTQAYFDTGASGILIAQSRADLLGIPMTTTVFTDVGVGGSDQFRVSGNVRVSLADFYTRTDLDQFTSGTHSNLTPYTPIATAPVRLQVGPYTPVVSDPDQAELEALFAGLNALNVVGTPAMKGKVVVMDPTRVNGFISVYTALLDAVDSGDASGLEALLNADVYMHTHVYTPGTPFRPGTVATDPGIPATTHHVKLSYASFDRFTSVSPAGAAGPTLDHNPFIGADPVAVLNGTSPANAPPGVKISRTIPLAGGGTTTFTSEGNWLLDTGAAASMISLAQAANLHVHYQTPPSAENTNPVLVDDAGVPLGEQFTLSLSGVGGDVTVAGFYLNSLLVRTMEGVAANDNDPNHLRFLHAPVLVANISLMDPVTHQALTLDGVFGMNYLVASADLTQAAGDILPTFTGFSSSYFDWITFDEPNGVLGLSFAGTPVNWNGAAGNWSDAAKWSTAAVPNNGTTPTATFDVTIAGGNVNMNVDASIHLLNFSSGTMTGSGNLTVSGGTVNGTYNVLGKTTVNGGVLLFNGTTHNAGAFGGTGSIQVSAGVTLTSDAVTVAGWTVNGTHVLRPHATAVGTSKVGALTLGAAGKVDLTNNLLIVQPTAADKAGVLAAIRGRVAAGAGGGAGITSATTLADPVHKVTVVVDNALLGLTTFGGLAVDENSVLVGSTWFGDSNLDRQVNVTDLGQLATHYGQATTLGVLAGDFNSDGVVNVTDLGMLATNYGKGTGGAVFSLEADLAAFSLPTAGVPEPGTLALLGLPLVWGMRRRGVRLS